MSGLIPHTLRLDQPDDDDASAPQGDPIEVMVENATSNPDSQALNVEVYADGSATVTFGNVNAEAANSDHFDENLATKIADQDLMRIGEDLYRGIQSDEESRREWLEDRAEGLKLLALKIEKPGSQASDGTADLAGMAKVRHPMMLEAVLRFQANAQAELLPADGPVKVRVDDTDQSGAPKPPGIGHNGGPALDDHEASDANQLETDMNHWLTAVATEYYPDTERMLLQVGFCGAGFKKVYRCPLRRRPTSESVAAEDLIVSNNATDLGNAARVTHQIKMTQATLKRMQVMKAYRDVPLSAPVQDTTNSLQLAKDNVDGTNRNATLPEDQQYTIYESDCLLDIPGYEHRDGGEITGLPRPYRVTLEKNSKVILAIRRNWAEDDEIELRRNTYVKFPFVPGFGFWDIGLLQIMGGTTMAATAMWRILIDNGMFSNFPGFLYDKAIGRQLTNEFRVAPGGGVPVDLGMRKMSDAIMPLPYQKPDAATMQMTENIVETGSRVGGTAEIQVGEGRQDAPVGTTIALIEQAMKVMGAVHKRLCRAQSEELQLLKDLFRQYPEDFWRVGKKRASKWTKESFLRALENTDLVAAADPNTASHMQRVMAAQALFMMAKEAPLLFNLPEVQKYVMEMSRIPNPERFMASPGAQGPNPELIAKGVEAQAKMIDAQAKLADVQAKMGANQADLAETKVYAEDVRVDAENRAADREQRREESAVELATEAMRNPLGLGAAQGAGLIPN